MAIISSGVICDICGQYILLEEYDIFTLRGYDKEFHCHTSGDCKGILFEAETWKDLPAESLIRRAMEVVDKKVERLIN